MYPYIGSGKVLTHLGVGRSSNSACQLPAVSWVIPDGNWSDHAGLTSNGNVFGPLGWATSSMPSAATTTPGAKLPVQCYDVIVAWFTS